MAKSISKKTNNTKSLPPRPRTIDDLSSAIDLVIKEAEALQAAETSDDNKQILDIIAMTALGLQYQINNIEH